MGPADKRNEKKYLLNLTVYLNKIRGIKYFIKNRFYYKIG